MLAVIMAGGVGERFWPLSRRRHPKQLLDLTGRGSMLRLTVERLEGLCDPGEIMIITNVQQRDDVMRDVGDLVRAENVVGEPVGKNTAPCIGLAAVLQTRSHGDGAMVVLPADHLVEPRDDFHQALRAGAEFAESTGELLTFGITPSRPETGYGYIEAGDVVASRSDRRIRRAKAFHEKPSPERAKDFVAAGNYYWNSGIFMWTASAIREAIGRHMPELDRVLSAMEDELGTRSVEAVLNSLYHQAPSESIDYGVMEKADNVAMLEAGFSWNDVGSWEFIRDVHEADEDGNVAVGDHLMVDSRNNTLVSDRRFVGVLGVDDLVVVDSEDALLVCKRDRVQEIKKLVSMLRKEKREELF